MTAAMIISIGSRGDTEPFLSLATKLLTHFDTIHIFHLNDYVNLIPRNPRIISHPFPFGADDFWPIYKAHIFKSLLFSVFTGFDLIKIQTECMALLITKLFIPTTKTVLDLAEDIDPSVVIATTLGMSVGVTVAEKRDIPFCFVNFQPNTPTTAYPYYMHGVNNALLAGEEVAKMHGQSPSEYTSSEEFLRTYDSQYDLFIPSLPQLNLIRESCGLGEMREKDIRDVICGRYPNVHIINSFCKPLIPDSLDHSETVHIVPPLADGYLPDGWSATKSCPEVAEYLSVGEKPVCVTFGSMGSSISNASVTRELFYGLRAAGVTRVLVLNGTTDLGVHNLWRFRNGELIDWAEKHVFVTKEKPQFAWLFPLCKAVICHGGAGTTFAGLRARIPVIISPVLCDQFFWGRLLERLQLGAVAGPKLQSATSESFKLALESVTDLKILERLERFGEVERSGGDGSIVAADLINTLAQSRRTTK